MAIMQGPQAWLGFLSPILFVVSLLVLFFVAVAVVLYVFSRPKKLPPVDPRPYREK